MRSDGTFSVRLPGEWRERLTRQAAAIGISPHAFVRATLIGRLRRLAEMEHGRADPDAPDGVRMRVLLDDVRTARGQGAPLVTLRANEAEAMLEMALRVDEEERAG